MPDKKYTKADLTDALYDKTGTERNEIRSIIDYFLDEMKTALSEGHAIELRGFGTFDIKIRKARTRARNPKTGEKIAIHSHGTVIFRSGRELKQSVWKITDEIKPEDY